MLLKTEVTTQRGKITKVSGIHAGYYKDEVKKLPPLEQLNALGKKLWTEHFVEDLDLQREDHEDKILVRVFVKETK